MSDSLQRPPQATLAAWVTIVGSVVVVLTSFEVVGGLRSLETREAVETFLSEPPGDGLGIGVQGALRALHVAAMIAAGCATAAAILGWRVLKRDRVARIALSLLSVPLFLAGMVTGGFMSSVVAVAALLLWLQPTRSWFDGVAYAPAERRSSSHPGPASGGALPPGAGSDLSSGPAPAPPPGAAGGPGTPVPGAPATGSAGDPGSTGARAWQGFGTAPVARDGVVPDRRPTAVTIACTLTWIFAGLLGVLMLASMVIISLDPEHWIGELRKQNPELAQQAEVTDNLLSAAILFVGGVSILWAVTAIVLAWFVLRRAAWARILLIVSAAVTATFALVASLTNPALIVVLLAATLTISCLLRPEVRAWFRARPSA